MKMSPRTGRDEGHSRSASLLSSRSLLLLHKASSNPAVELAVSHHAVMTVWHRGTAKISRPLRNAPPEVSAAHKPTCHLPYDVVEMIAAHLADDPDTLRACSLTCRSWNTAAAPHIHRTLLLGEKNPGSPSGDLWPLPELHGRGLIPFVKEIRVKQWHSRPNWFLPRAFSSSDLRYFSAFTNVQTLIIQRLDIYCFIPGIERYFEQFAPTLRSISLFRPTCGTLQQLPYFLSLFPNLDNIDILQFHLLHVPTPTAELAPFSVPKLRGELTLHDFHSIKTWTHMITVCGGLRFRYMELCQVGGCAPTLLKACANTLETLRFYVADGLGE